MDEETIKDFLKRILPDFKHLIEDLKKIHPEWSESDLAGNIMEFGRGQISEIEEPKEKDIKFIDSYIKSLKFDSSLKPFFVAYSAGCIMGLVQSNQLSPDKFIETVKLSRQFSSEMV